MSSPSPSPAPSAAPALPDFAGVYVAKPQQLLIGPLTHLEHFFTALAGVPFGSGNVGNSKADTSILPPLTLRYVVDCAPHVSDLPPLPSYATVPSSPAPGDATPITTATTPPPTSAVKETSPADAVCPATMSLHTGADENAKSNDVAATSAFLSPPPAAMTTSDVVQRMNKNAEACLERLRQRCVQNGMSTAVFSSAAARRASSTAAAPAELSSQNSLGSAAALLSAAPSQQTPEPLPLSTPAAAPTTAVQPPPSAAAPADSNAKAHALTAAKTELAAQAAQNDALSAAAVAALGADHVLRCLIPHTDNSLASAAVQDTVARVQTILQSNPDAQVYFYSLDGKGTASALAALYLLQVDHVPLSEVLLRRLPACTPRMSCLVQLVARDPSPQTFDKSAYLRLYLARRYPSASAPSIEAAVSTCKGNFVKAERLVRQELSFQRADDGFRPRRELRGSSSARASCAPSLSNISSAQVQSSGYVDASLSDFSLCSSFIKEPVKLTEGDETVVDSLYKALADGRVGVSRDDVRESYIVHRRSQDMVLRQFLLRFRAAEQPSSAASGANFGTSPSSVTTPTRLRPLMSYGSHATYSGNGTPRAGQVEEIALPLFTAQPASRRGSAACVGVGGGGGSTTPTVVTPLTATAGTPEPIQPQQKQQDSSELLSSPAPTKPSGTAKRAAARQASARTPASLPQQAAAAAASTTTPRAKASKRDGAATPTRAATTATSAAAADTPSPTAPATGKKKKVGKSATTAAAAETPSGPARPSLSPNKTGTSTTPKKAAASATTATVKTPKAKAKTATKAAHKSAKAALVA